MKPGTLRSHFDRDLLIPSRNTSTIAVTNYKKKQRNKRKESEGTGKEKAAKKLRQGAVENLALELIINAIVQKRENISREIFRRGESFDGLANKRHGDVESKANYEKEEGTK